MSRARFTQSDADRIAKAAAKYGVTIRGEFFGQDGSKAVLYAGKPDVMSSEGNCKNDLDQWIAEA